MAHSGVESLGGRGQAQRSNPLARLKADDGFAYFVVYRCAFTHSLAMSPSAWMMTLAGVTRQETRRLVSNSNFSALRIISSHVTSAFA